MKAGEGHRAQLGSGEGHRAKGVKVFGTDKACLEEPRGVGQWAPEPRVWAGF